MRGMDFASGEVKGWKISWVLNLAQAKTVKVSQCSSELSAEISWIFSLLLLVTFGTELPIWHCLFVCLNLTHYIVILCY